MCEDIAKSVASLTACAARSFITFRPYYLQTFRQSLSNWIGRPIRIRIESRSFAGPYIES